jgi:hypothetical protein
MNQINFDLIVEEDSEEKNIYNIAIEAIIDNKKIFNYKDFPINILELIKSKKSNGNFYIFTCSCGIPECGGVNPIYVKHNDNKISWKFNKSHFVFIKDDYIQKIYKVINDFLENYYILQELNTKISIYPEIFLELKNDEIFIDKLKKIRLLDF